MKKKKKEGGANKATVDLPGAGTVGGGDTSSSSEEPSPYWSTEQKGCIPKARGSQESNSLLLPILRRYSRGHRGDD